MSPLTDSQTIPDLPAPLRAVPTPPLGPDDPLWAQKRAEQQAWIDGVRRYRDEVTILTADSTPGHEHLRAIERVRCERDLVYFVTVYCSLKETRIAEDDDAPAGWQPAIPYAFQVGMMRWVIWLIEQQKTGLKSKSRDMGATWFDCLVVLGAWLFWPTFTAKLVSRGQAYVDSNSEDAMFSRIMAQFDYKGGDAAGNPYAIPRWLWPKGFKPEKHKTELLLRNPANGNEINGEATTMRAGRGGRCTFALSDELAFQQDGRHTFSTMRATAGSRLGLSSESLEVSDDFMQMVSARKARAPETVLELDYWLHPHHDQDWLDEQKADYEADDNLPAFYREVLRDPAAGLTSWLYPKARDIYNEIHQHKRPHPYLRGAPVWVTMDPGFDDDCAVHWISREPLTGRYRVIASYANSHQVPEFYAALIQGHDDPQGRWVMHQPERDLMAWVKTLPRPRFVFGDPAGKQRHVGDDTTWYALMQRYWRQHGWVQVVTHDRVTQTDRTAQNQRNALNSLLPNLDFHYTPQVIETLRCIAESRLDETGNRKTEQKDAPHDHDLTHRTSALAYFAISMQKITVMVGASYKPLRGKDRARKKAA